MLFKMFTSTFERIKDEIFVNWWFFLFFFNVIVAFTAILNFVRVIFQRFLILPSRFFYFDEIVSFYYAWSRSRLFKELCLGLLFCGTRHIYTPKQIIIFQLFPTWKIILERAKFFWGCRTCGVFLVMIGLSFHTQIFVISRIALGVDDLSKVQMEIFETVFTLFLLLQGVDITHVDL